MKLRKASQQDCNLIFNWSNDPLVRSQSYHSEAIIWENHVQWFEHQLARPALSAFFIGEEEDETPIGLVRFSKEEDHWIIGVLIDKNQRGKGWSSKLIKAGCELFDKNDEDSVYAYIKKENIASIKSFERAGFVLIRQLRYKNQPSYLYEWK